VSKVFPGQRALDGVDLDLAAGSVHALVGANGSGKSTLIKILAGYHTPEPESTATLDGSEFKLGSASAAEEAGMRFIHQDLGLIPDLNAVDNMALTHGYTSRRFVRLRHEARVAQDVLRRFGSHVDVHKPIRELSLGDRSVVAIARALNTPNQGGTRIRVLVLDEPTESLSRPEVTRLFTAVRAVAAHGAAVLYVSHVLEDVLKLADVVTVLRDGRVVTTRPADTLDHDSLVELIVGRALTKASVTVRASGKGVALRAIDLEGGTVRPLSFEVRRGEIVGFAGIGGSGREELPRLLGGGGDWVGGIVEVDSRAYTKLTPRQALAAGLAFVPSDRQTLSAIPSLSVRENLTLPRVSTFGPLRWLSAVRERAEAREWMVRTDVRPVEPDRPLGTLSGGNQQKLVMARALRLEPSVMVLDEPVQGVDVGAKSLIFDLIRAAAATGMAVVVASSDTDDLAMLCNRVLVLAGGHVVREVECDGEAAHDATEAIADATLLPPSTSLRASHA